MNKFKWAAVIFVLAAGVVALGWGANKRAARLQAEAEAAQKKETEMRREMFSAALRELEAKKSISNAGAFLAEYDRYNANDSSDIFSLAKSAYRKNAAAGLGAYEAICLAFDDNAEMSEGVAEDVNMLLFQDSDRFVKGVAALDGSRFECLPKIIDLSWVETIRAEGFDSEAENKKLAARLKAGKFRNNVNVQKLVKALE